MKILSIGNSFSEDATAYLKPIADSAGMPLTNVNLYIGGCSLKTHAENIQAEQKRYRYEKDGLHTSRTVSVNEVLAEDTWDIVTVQQASHDSGDLSTYEPWGRAVVEYIRKNAPRSEIVFHQTWAYEPDSTHPGFARYGNDQSQMHSSIREATEAFCKENGIARILPCGDVIRALRALPPFDRAHGGQSLCRDGFHMHLIYGRYALGATWFELLCGGDIRESSFFPTASDVKNGYVFPADFRTDPETIKTIQTTVHQILHP